MAGRRIQTFLAISKAAPVGFHLMRGTRRQQSSGPRIRMSAMSILEPTTSSTPLDLSWVRSQFPALAQMANGRPMVFLDGPGGTQVPQRVIDAIADYKY